MLFAKSAFLLSLFALSNIAVAADSSACLLSALGSEKSPGDLKAVCVDRVQKKIANACSDDDKEDALKQFADTCSSANHKVVINSSSSADSSTGTATGTSTGSSKSTKTASTGTGFVTASATSTSGSGSSSGSGSDSGSDSGSGSSSNVESSPSSTSEEIPLQTNSAGSSDKHVSAAAFAAVVFVGFAATL